jgi:hypothetical protein
MHATCEQFVRSEESVGMTRVPRHHLVVHQVKVLRDEWRRVARALAVCAVAAAGVGAGAVRGHAGGQERGAKRIRAAASRAVDPLGTWTVKRHVAPSGFEGVWCASPSLCLAATDTGPMMTSTDPAKGASATWSLDKVNDGGYSAWASCSPSLCVLATGNGQVLTSSDPRAGPSARWAEESIGSTLAGMSCPTRTLCVTTNLYHSVLTSRNPEAGGSATWVAKTVEPFTSDADVGGVSCASARLCVAFNDAGNVYTTTAPSLGEKARWVPKHLDVTSLTTVFTNTADETVTKEQPATLTAISCNPSLCALTDMAGDVLVSTDAARGAAGTWSVEHVEPPNTPTFTSSRGFSDISCPSARLCVATNGDGAAAISTDPGAGASAKWEYGTIDPAAPTGSTISISCPTPSFCVAVDVNGNILTSRDPGH